MQAKTLDSVMPIFLHLYHEQNACNYEGYLFQNRRLESQIKFIFFRLRYKKNLCHQIKRSRFNADVFYLSKI